LNNFGNGVMVNSTDALPLLATIAGNYIGIDITARSICQRRQRREASPAARRFRTIHFRQYATASRPTATARRSRNSSAPMRAARGNCRTSPMGCMSTGSSESVIATDCL